jgi:hypothetical protein
MNSVRGLDVHKSNIFARILDVQGKKILEKLYGALTPELTQLHDMLIDYGCGTAAMESTSTYRKPVWRVLRCSNSVWIK